MKKLDWYDYVMILVGLFIGSNVFFHEYAMFTVKSSLGQSAWAPIQLIIGLGFWLYYGIRKELPTVIITNSMGILFNLSYLGFILYYK